MRFKSELYPGEKAICSLLALSERKGPIIITRTFQKGKPHVAKKNNYGLFGFYFGRLGSFFPEEANAVLDFKPCKFYCQTDIPQKMEGNYFGYRNIASW